ncbi:chemotaxis protein CheW [Halobacteriales archaeon Cl-PHB]
MSDQERMDRAERIRRMREGRRGDADDSEESADDGAAATPDAAASDDGAQTDQTPTETPARTNGGSAAATEPAETAAPADEAKQADAEVDDVVADAVDRISGASASLPDAAEVDPEAAEHVEPAEDDATAAADEAADTDGEPAAETETDDDGTEETRVLEFTLDDEQYCLDIDYIEEIVKHEHITRVPNTPAFVEGVVDLRGQITTILNPKIPIEKENTEPGDLIVVFDAEAFDEQGYLGWVVDDVRQVSPVTDGEVNHPPMDEDYITGVIDREDDDQFVIWTTPDLALEEAA